MSLFRRKQTYLIIAWDCVGVVFVERALMDKVHFVDVLGVSRSSDSLSSVLDSIERLIPIVQEWNWLNSDLLITLSDEFVRHFIIPAAVPLSLKERKEFSYALFEDVFRQSRMGWSIVADDELNSGKSLACAVELSIIRALEEFTAQLDLKLKSIRSSLVQRLNAQKLRFSELIGRELWLFFSAEVITVVTLSSDGLYDVVRTAAPRLINRDELIKLTERELFSRGLDQSSRVIIFPSTDQQRNLAESAGLCIGTPPQSFAGFNALDLTRYPFSLGLPARR